jgi:hypothetical protein
VLCFIAGKQLEHTLSQPACYTRDATKLLVQLDVLCNVAGKQLELTSTTILPSIQILRQEITGFSDLAGTCRYQCQSSLPKCQFCLPVPVCERSPTAFLTHFGLLWAPFCDPFWLILARKVDFETSCGSGGVEMRFWSDFWLDHRWADH